MRGRLGREASVEVARSLARDLDADHRIRAAQALLDLSAAPEGKIRDATGLLMISDEEVNRNTADRILGGDVAVHYIEDLSRPPNVESLVSAYNRDPADWTF
jgi:hypothetical protein